MRESGRLANTRFFMTDVKQLGSERIGIAAK